MKSLSIFCNKYKDLPTLGFTHYQPAQLVTVGKRAALWLQDFLMDFHQLTSLIEQLPLRGIKGTTGTQASFLELFDGDHEKVNRLNKLIATKLGFEKIISLSGQTYTRKIDYQILSTLSAIAQSAYKFAGDIRLLANLKEIEEPFNENQIGSSAMAYKRNPMRCERICSLARFVMSLSSNASNTAANQWFERTLDDSANRRLSLPQAFLGIDVILNLSVNVINGLQVWPKVIYSRIMSELPFMTTETILMSAVKAGGDRQVLHEAIRKHSMIAIKQVKNDGMTNDLIERIREDEMFASVHDNLNDLLDPSLFIGRCQEQVQIFLLETINPLLEKYKYVLNTKLEDMVNV